jgi:hypothetical protein
MVTMMSITCRNDEVVMPQSYAPFHSIDEMSYFFQYLPPFTLCAASCVCRTWSTMSQEILGKMKGLVLGKTMWIRYGDIGDEPFISAKGLLSLFSQVVNPEAFLVPACLDDVAMKNVIIERDIVQSSKINLESTQQNMFLNVNQSYWMVIGNSTKQHGDSNLKLYAPTLVEAIIILTFSRYFQQSSSQEIVCQEKTQIGPHRVFISCKKINDKVHILGSFSRTHRHNKIQIFGRN